MTDINELRRLAQMATPGPWMIDYVGVGFEVAAGESVIAQSQQIQGDRRHNTRKANAAFIAAANPAAISDLLDRLEAAEKSDAESIAMYRKARDERDNLRIENEALRAEVTHIKEVEFPRKAQAVADCWRVKCERLEAKIAEMEKQEPIGEIVAFGEFLHEPSWKRGKLPHLGTKLYALPGAAPEPSESEARMRWLLRQIVHALPSRRDWLDPAIEREARIATTPEANHDPR